ncbi:MAG TPA: glycosyltransferase [Syntrophorhabdaceae bacterium]|jgi:glycosyltransferase involved in cell wall biosynthesis
MFLRSSMPAEPNIKVSIAMITYNHERFIEKALEGVIMQKTNFTYKAVIGEDCSTDRTRNIVLDYQRRYPDKFMVLLNDRNLGMHKNAAGVLKACEGRYVTCLEGDDYWTSPEKLQKQVDFMDSHPECPMCFHDAEIEFDPEYEGEKFALPERKKNSVAPPVSWNNLSGRNTNPTLEKVEWIDMERLLPLDMFIPTASAMFRREVCVDLPEWVDSLQMRDWPAIILAARRGRIAYMDEKMSVYFVHSGGQWNWYRNHWAKEQEARIDLWRALRKNIGREYRGSIDRILRYQLFLVSQTYGNRGDWGNARAYALRALLQHLRMTIQGLTSGERSVVTASLPDVIGTFKGTMVPKNFLRLQFPKMYRYFNQYRNLD